MRKWRNRKPVSKKGFVLIRIGMLLLACSLILALFDLRLRPVVVDMAAHQAKVAAMRCINDAMAAAISEEGVGYKDIVLVAENSRGEVASIQSNMMMINYLKVQVTNHIMEEISKEKNQRVEIPLGTLSGFQLASGRGPLVEIKVLPEGYVQTRIYNQFTSAGINQTLHRIMLEASIQMIVIIPGYTIRAETVTNYCIAETVIVGNIPEGYTDIDGDNSSTISKLNDYTPF